MKIRPIKDNDTTCVCRLTRDTGKFYDHEIPHLRELLRGYILANPRNANCIVMEENKKLLGFAYYALDEITDGTWYLWWIAVDKVSQGQGVGRKLMNHMEKHITNREGRQILIETSSAPWYKETRQFYIKNNYERVALLENYYKQGDGMAIYQKSLCP